MKKRIILLLTAFYIMTVGYTNTINVTAEVEELPIKELEVTYAGKVRKGETLNKDDFTVIPYYEWNNNGDINIYKGEPVDSDEFTITPEIMTNDTETVRVSFKDAYKDIEVTCLAKGRLTIQTKGLQADFTVEAIKQVVDDNLLDGGKDITYTIQQTEKNEPISEELTTVISEQKNSEETLGILKVYDISIEKEVTGEEIANISQTNNAIYITLNIPEQYIKADRVYWMAHQHENVVEILMDTDNDNKTITVQTATFSDYVLYYTEKIVNNNKKPSPGNSNNKGSGDKEPSRNEDNSEDMIPSVPFHTHTHTEVIEKATCTKGEYRTITCTICGSSERKLIADALGHDWTLQENNTAVCRRCGLINENAIPKKKSTENAKQKVILADKTPQNKEQNDDSYLKTKESEIVPSVPVDNYVLDDGEKIVISPSKEESQEPSNNDTNLQMEQEKEKDNSFMGWICPLSMLLLLLLLIIVIIISKKRQEEE